MRVSVVCDKWNHHSAHSGYDQLCRHLGADQLAPGILYRILHKVPKSVGHAFPDIWEQWRVPYHSARELDVFLRSLWRSRPRNTKKSRNSSTGWKNLNQISTTAWSHECSAANPAPSAAPRAQAQYSSTWTAPSTHAAKAAKCATATYMNNLSKKSGPESRPPASGKRYSRPNARNA